MEDLFQARLRQMLFVELTLADDRLPRLLDRAHSTDLRHAFERHLVQTREHVRAVREILSELQARAEPEPSPALLGLVEEHEQLLKRIESTGNLVSDLALATAATATEHLEMSSYEMLASMAEALGEEELAVRLRDLLEQEEVALEFVGRALAKLLAERVESERI